MRCHEVAGGGWVQMAVGLGLKYPKQVADHKSAATISTVIVADWPLEDSRVFTNLSEGVVHNKLTFTWQQPGSLGHYHDPGHQLPTPSSFHFCHSTSPARMEIAPPPCNSKGHKMS